VSKYRRIEVNAYHRRVTVVSGDWRPDDSFEAQRADTGDGVSLNDTDVCEPVTPDSPEGQLILVEAVRTLERRLSPEVLMTIRTDPNSLTTTDRSRNSFYRMLQSFVELVCPRVLRIAKKEK